MAVTVQEVPLPGQLTKQQGRLLNLNSRQSPLDHPFDAPHSRNIQWFKCLLHQIVIRACIGTCKPTTRPVRMKDAQ
jgi:hypothetical protein